MRLISIETLRLETFISESSIPPFAILSHTWGLDEPTLQDALLPAATLSHRRGWQKITRFRDAVCKYRHLLPEPVKYLWVDTVCIDKTSSAELSESINSMFRWYRNAVCCFAVLEDVEVGNEYLGEDFEVSKWFTRGWTLQELLAPRDVHFFDKNWECIGSRATLVSRISARTNISEDAIITGEWAHATVAQRMSWASSRETTRPEDMAYCLLGIFDVNMPMLYGEGEKAFVRLQEEIIKDSDDESIFAWDASGVDSGVTGIFATHPRQFAGCANFESLPSDTSPFLLTNKGLQITVPIIEREEEPGQKVALLSCNDARDAASLIGIKVRPDDLVATRCARVPGPPLVIPVRDRVVFREFMRSIYLVRRNLALPVDKRPPKLYIRGPPGGLPGLEFIGASPQSWHHSKTNALTLQVPKASGNSAGGATSALLFKLEGTARSFFLVLSVEPTEHIVQVGLVSGPDTPPEGEALNKILKTLAVSADDIVDGEIGELVIGEERVTAKVDAGRGSMVIEVVLRRCLKDGFVMPMRVSQY